MSSEAHADPAETATTPTSNLIVVGVSGVTGSRAALQWAAHEARLRRGTVRAVMAWRDSGLPGFAPGRAPAQSVTSAGRQQRGVEQELDRFVADALGTDHGVECRALQGKAGAVLLQEAADADLLVLDSPAVSRLYEPQARRLAPQLIARAPCPVVVMPATAHPEDDWQDADDTAGEYVGEPEPRPTG